MALIILKLHYLDNMRLPDRESRKILTVYVGSTYDILFTSYVKFL
jgi:hypothetical protein